MSKEKSSTVAVCPFFGGRGGTNVSCEGAKFRFADESCTAELKKKYCYDMDGHKQCTVYKILMAYYEREQT